MADAKPRKRVNYANVRAEARHLIHTHRKSLAIGMVLMLINRVSGLVLPGSTQFLIDDVLGQGRSDLLLPIAAAVGVATLIQAFTSFTLSQVVSVAAQGAIAEMRKDVQAHVLRLPVSYFDEHKTGVLISRIMNDPEGIRNLVGTGLIQLIGGLVTAVLALLILLDRHWQMTIGTIGLLVLFAGVMSYAFNRLRPIFRERGEIQAQVTGRLTETLGGARLVKVYVAEPREEAVFGEGVGRLFRNIASTITGTSVVHGFATVVVGAVGLLIMVIGGRAVLGGTMSTGELVSYTFFVGLMVAPLIQIASIGTQITEAFAGLDRIHEVRNVATEDDLDADKARLGDVSGEITVEAVSFGYRPDVPVLHDVTVHAPAGTTTALVGPSGAGKSTLISLLMAFHRPQRGRILVDGRDLASIRLHDFRRQLGVVMQDNFLFDGTIRENIAYGNPDASEEEVRRAGRIAHCDEFVDRFEKGYDTIVGERGVKLSGGQRQRVAIARAIVADPRILILDEATSSLDSEAEALIRDGLRSLRRGRTTFVIAHRLSTIRTADQILVLDEGRVVERGTHDELMEEHGLYRQLYEKQYGLVADLFINPGEEPQPDALAAQASGRG